MIIIVQQGFIFPKLNSHSCMTQPLCEKPFGLVFLLSRSSGSHAFMPVILTNELLYLKSMFFKSFHEHNTATYTDVRDLMTQISCYHVHEGNPHIALKPEVRSANSSTCAMPKSCSRESGCHESSAEHKKTNTSTTEQKQEK